MIDKFMCVKKFDFVEEMVVNFVLINYIIIGYVLCGINV